MVQLFPCHPAARAHYTRLSEATSVASEADAAFGSAVPAFLTLRRHITIAVGTQPISSNWSRSELASLRQQQNSGAGDLLKKPATASYALDCQRNEGNSKNLHEGVQKQKKL